MSWHLPVEGDSRWLGTATAESPPTWPLLRGIAQRADEMGFDTILVPTAFTNGQYSEHSPLADSWTIGTAVAAVTHRIRLLIALRPGFIHPGVAAMMAATFDDISGSRLAYNIVTAGAPGDMEMFGDTLGHDERYWRAREFMGILNTLWSSDGITHTSSNYRLDSASVHPQPALRPTFYLAGASRAALEAAAEHADLYLMSAEPPDVIRARVLEASELAAQRGRSMRFGIAGTLIARDTHEAAWQHAKAMLDHADPKILHARGGSRHRTTSVEDTRFRQLGDVRMADNLWAGMSQLAYGSAFVGCPDGLLELFAEYVEAGVSMFQFYAFPNAEEIERVAEQLLPGLHLMSPRPNVTRELR